MSEEEKMLRGELYFAPDEELAAMRERAKKIWREYNSTFNSALLEQLFAKKLDNLIIEPPFYCDYGCNIKFGKDVFINYNCVILDCAEVKIGDNTLLGPNVQIYCPEHPLDFETRNKLLEYAMPVTIGKNCWIGGSVVILGGVSIGDGAVIGAGSVVTHDIKSNVVAVGNPCKIIHDV